MYDLVLSVDGSKRLATAYLDENDENQLWNVTIVTNGWGPITHAKTGLVMDVFNSGGTGSEVGIFPLSGGNNQLWKFENDQLIPLHGAGELALDINHDTPTAGINVKVTQIEDTSITQKWSFESIKTQEEQGKKKTFFLFLDLIDST